MEPLWIGGILLAILILVLVLAYLLFYNEQSFEDALASQNASSDILIQSKNAAGKSGLKQRKKPKKERPRSAVEGSNEKVSKQDQKHLEACEDSDHSTFSITLAEEAASLLQSSPEKSTLVESSEEEKPLPKPKKKLKTRDKRKSDHSRVAGETSKEQEPVAVKEEILVQESVVKTNSEDVLQGLPPIADEEALFPKDDAIIPSATSGKKTKKPKSKEKSMIAEPTGLKALLEALEISNLNHSEIQKIVDVLLDKQKSAEQWKKSGGKPDPIDVLRKQLNEKEEAYKEEHVRAEQLAVKVKELRDELGQGAIKQKSYETSAAQKIKALEKENEALQQRMSASHQNNALEHEKLLASLEICKKTHDQTGSHKLQEELASAKDFIQQSENQKADLEAKILALEKDIKSRKDNESILAQQATEANDRAKNFDAVKNSLSQQLMETVKLKSDSEHQLDVAKKDAESAHTEKSSAIQKAGALQTQLDEERSKKSEMEKMFKALEQKLKDSSDKHMQEKEVLVKQLESASGKKNDTDVAELQQQCDDASRQLDELKGKLTQAEDNHGKTKQSLASKEQQLSQHEGEINELRSLNSSKDEELVLLRKTVSEHENEIVVMKNNVSQELQSAPPEVDVTKVKSLEEEIEKLTGQLKEKKEQVESMEKSIEGMKSKNNELREKNWKAMDALSVAEKQHKADIGKAVGSVQDDNEKNLETLHSGIKEFLCRIHPTLEMDKTLSYKEFLGKYENAMMEFGSMSPETESNDSKLGELEEELKKSIANNDKLIAQCNEYKTSLAGKENEFNEIVKKNEELDGQCNKYKTLLGSTENMLHELEDNVENEMTNMKATLAGKEAELEKANSSLSEVNEKLQKALDDAKSKDEEIASLQKDLSSKASLGDKESELQKMTSAMDELKENLRKKEEDAKKKELTITSLQKDVTQATGSVTGLKEDVRKASEESKSKVTKINSLQLELSTLKKAAVKSSEDSKNELKKLSDDVERYKEEKKSLEKDLEVAKNEAKLRAEEDKSPELEKYKNEALDASKVNAALRKELEEVRMQDGALKSPKKKHDKENDAKVKALEEKLAIAAKKESELQAKIAHLEDSASNASLDDENASPDAKEKKKKRGFSLMGSKSSKYEGKYRDMSEKYEQVKTESDEKTSRINELETKLKTSEKALETQEEKVKELKAQVGLANGGVQNTGATLNESQMKQMAEAMKDGDLTGAV